MNGAVYLTELPPGTTYHFRAKAVNDQGTVYSADQTFTTLNLPVINTTAATAVTDVSATLNGTINPGGGAYSLRFEWGTTTAYGSSDYTSASGTAVVAVSTNITGLQPNTTYHFRLTIFGSSYQSADVTFTTVAPATPPTISSTSSSSSSPTTTSLQAFVHTGSSPTTLSFEYGNTTAYGSVAVYSTTLATSTSSFASVSLANLTPGTTYHYRAKAVNTSATVYSTDRTFTTPNNPILTTVAATSISDLGATLNGTVNPGGASFSTYFDWGLTTVYGNSSSVYVSGSATTAISTTIYGLLPSTTYHFRVRNSNGTYFGSDMMFTTAAPATPPTINYTLIYNFTMTSARLDASIDAGSSTTTLSFEYGTTAAYGAEVIYPTTFPVNTDSSGSVTLANLTPGTTYHYRARAVNAEGTTYSPDKTFTTLAPPILTTINATAVTDLTATLNGTLTAGGGYVNTIFQWGTTLAYGNTISGSSASGTTTTPSSANLTGLLPNTTYHFRIATSDVSYYGADMTFTTGAPATPPSISSTSSSSISPTTASLSATLSTGSSPATLSFEYGTSSSYGSETSYAQTLASNAYAGGNVALANLQPGTVYHFRSKAANAQGTTYSTDNIFTTLNLPVVTTTAATAVTDLSAAFNGTVNAGGGVISIYFDWGNT